MALQKTVLITGSSSGIGAAFAKNLAIHGYNLILVARREEKLHNLCKEFELKYKINAQYLILDLAKANDIKVLEKKIAETQNLEGLINNAGYGLKETFQNSNIDELSEIITVHNIAVVRLTHAAIPIMLKNHQGFIINVSSVAAFLISPVNPMYCATKTFINNFTESLHIELLDTGIKVQALCPGYTLTDFHRKLGYDKNDPMFKKFMSANYVVEYSLKDLKRNKIISIPGFKYKFIKLVALIPRRLFYQIVLNGSKILSKKYLATFSTIFQTQRRKNGNNSKKL